VVHFVCPQSRPCPAFSPAMPAAAAGGLPAELARLAATFPSEPKAKFLELHRIYHFDEDFVECFTINHGDLTADRVVVFQEYLARQRAPPQQRESAGPQSTGTAEAPVAPKRRPPGAANAAMALPGGVGAALGRTEAPSQAQEATTPCPKRRREAMGNDADGEAQVPSEAKQEESTVSGGTPDPPPRPSRSVALKTSVNSAALMKPLSDAGDRPAVEVQLLGDSALWSGSRHGCYEWMDEALEERSAHLNERLSVLEGKVAEAMCIKYQDGEDRPAVGTIGRPSQAEVVLCGRVACEGLEGKLNERSILLEGSRASTSVRLSLTECRALAAFPGQVVGVLGRSGMSGGTFHAREFLPGLPLETAGGSSAPSGTRPLHMMVASGPFCLRNGLDYAPLERVLEHAVREQPQVLVLMGPFLDSNNQKVVAGDPMLPHDKEPCSFEEIYKRVILPTLATGLAPLRRANPPTEVFLVPSLDEVLCFHPMPQPPLDASLDLEASAMGRLKQMGIRFLPNPAHLLIDGLRVSFSSADALSPILRDFVLRPEGRKIDEALRLLLWQRTLFPVLPREPVQVSEARAAALDFPDAVVPDVCVFPSIVGVPTGNFVEQTVFVNPGTVCRPAALGSFAEFWVLPGASTSLATGVVPLRERTRIDIQSLS